MSFTTIQLQFLQRLVAERPPARPAGAAARHFCENFSIGVAFGNRIEYREGDYAQAQSVLGANELPVAALGPGASRADAAAYGGLSEKSLSAAPHSRSVAVKCLGACFLGEHDLLFTPPGGYLVLTPEAARRVKCDRIMVVENLETFRSLETYRWIERRSLNVLVIYRGDRQLPNKDAAHVLNAREEPIWAFFDFDPAGLGLANALPQGRLERIVLPAASWLEAAANTQRGRQLFDAQVAQYGKVLDEAQHPEVATAWQLMKRLRSAVTQERMAAAGSALG